jgi:hypothetical protein
MKEKIFFTVMLTLILTSVSFTQPPYKEKNFSRQKNMQNMQHREHQRIGLDMRIQNAIDTGLITKEEGETLLKQKQELENYRKTIWEDGVMTKEEKEKLLTLNKDFKEKMHSVLSKAMKNWEEKMSDTHHFYVLVQNLLKTEKITHQQADLLTKKIAELEKLETEIWQDDKMTKQEYEKFQQTKRLLKEEIRNSVKNSVSGRPGKKHMMKNKMRECPNDECLEPMSPDPLSPEKPSQH